MINFKHTNRFCKDDITLIENYEQALNDSTQTWDCHHRLETDLGLSVNELREQGKYFNVPANELIFLTHSDHMKLHTQGKESPMYRKHHSEESNRKRSEKLKGKKNGMYGKRGKNNPNYGKRQSEESNRKRSDSIKEWWKKHKDRRWMNNGTVCVFPKTQEEIDHYRELGYNFGRKLK